MNRRIFALLEGNIIREFYIGHDVELARSVAARYYIDSDALDVTEYDCSVGDIYKSGCIFKLNENGEIGSEVHREEISKEYEHRINLITNSYKNRIEFLENIIRNNGLEKFIE